MKVLIEISEKEFPFAMRVLKSLSFVKKAVPFSKSAIEIWDELTDSSEEIRLHKEGKVKLKSAEDLLNEL